MREILFRGKRTDNGEWVYGSFYMHAVEHFNGLCGVDGFIRLYDKAKSKMQTHEVDRETVGQYTGLTDKNGKRIFEGDIINGYSLTGLNDRRNCVVFWDELFLGWYAGECRSLYNNCGDIYEVIGNRWDNPELLKGGDG